MPSKKYILKTWHLQFYNNLFSKYWFGCIIALGFYDNAVSSEAEKFSRSGPRVFADHFCISCFSDYYAIG